MTLSVWIKNALLQILSEPFFTDRKGEVPEGKKGYYQMPIVHFHHNLVTTELEIGMAARQFAAEVDEVIQQADAAMDHVAAADHLRCSTPDKLKEIGLSEEQVLHYASKMADMMSKAVEVAHETCEYTKGGLFQRGGTSKCSTPKHATA